MKKAMGGSGAEQRFMSRVAERGPASSYRQRQANAAKKRAGRPGAITNSRSAQAIARRRKKSR